MAPTGWQYRLTVIPLPADLDALDDVVASHGVTEVVHCAGCLSYTDADALEAVNVLLTTALVKASARWGVDRFIHVSTAFAGGYQVAGEVVPEELHEGERIDPTPYSASKRRSEHVIARSGIPYLILRPSTVIGDSRTGQYSGPRYGLYQLWSAIERFLLDEWTPTIDFVAPDRPASPAPPGRLADRSRRRPQSSSRRSHLPSDHAGRAQRARHRSHVLRPAPPTRRGAVPRPDR